MKIRVVSSKDEIPQLMPNETYVHLTFRPSNKDIFKLIDSCPKIETIQLPKSYMKMLSQSIQYFLQNQHIKLVENDVWGCRSDLGKYCDSETGKVIVG